MPSDLVTAQVWVLQVCCMRAENTAWAPGLGRGVDGSTSPQETGKTWSPVPRVGALLGTPNPGLSFSAAERSPFPQAPERQAEGGHPPLPAPIQL